MSDDALKDKISDFLSVSPDVFWETDTSGKVTFLSMQITALTGHVPDELIGKPLASLFDGLPCEAQWKEWVTACQKGKMQPLDGISLVNEENKTVYISAYAQRFARGLRGYLRDVTEGVESHAAAHEVEQHLIDTIEAVPYGIALFDKDDRLVFVNNNSRDVFPPWPELVQPGTSFEEFVRKSFDDGVQNIPPEKKEEFVRKRLALHRNNYGQREVLLCHDRWVEISEHLTPEGNVVVSWSDITVQKRREQALSSLVSDPASHLSVSERAARAAALAMGCRWAGVVRWCENDPTADVVAFWDTTGFQAPFTYVCEGTPCQELYQTSGYLFLSEKLKKRFRLNSFLPGHELERYYGLSLRDQNGLLIGHIFVMDDQDHEGEFREGKEVLQLIGHWVEMEFAQQDMTQGMTDAQKRLLDFAEVASDWFWEVDETLEFKYISPHAPTYVQKSLHDLLHLAHGVNTPMHLRPFAMMQDFRDVSMSVPIEGADEDMNFVIGGRAVFDTGGEFSGYRGTGTDVTRIVAANQRASRAETWLLEALESSPEAFALYDKDDRLLICNQKFKDVFFPLAKDEVLPGKTFAEVQTLFLAQGIMDLPPERIGQWRENRLRERGMAGAGPAHETYAGGRTYMVVEHRTSEGGIASFYVDITQLHEQEQNLLKAKEQAESASRSKSDFLANISHELRTPLNAIIGFSELIRDELAGPPNSPKYKEYIGDIHNSGMHLMELINDILDLSKAEAGAIEGSERLTDVTEIIDACIKLMGPKAERAYVKLSSRYPDDLPQLWADPKHLRQILLNLVSNAVKFTPEGGSVEVSATLSSESGMTIAVRDTGIGMRPEDVPKALAPFGQIDSSLARKYNGTGLGLPLTQRLMDYYEGKLQIDTAPNKGTTVSIIFGPERLRFENNVRSIGHTVAE